MKFILLITLLMFSANLFAGSSVNKPELARFAIRCTGNSDSTQGTLDVDFNGTLSVFSKNQTGRLKLGSMGVFELIADFKFPLNLKTYGLIIFSFQNAEGRVLSKSSHTLPRDGFVATSIYFLDTASDTEANVSCSVSPESL